MKNLFINIYDAIIITYSNPCKIQPEITAMIDALVDLHRIHVNKIFQKNSLLVVRNDTIV
jgi:hypothetical protein